MFKTEFSEINQQNNIYKKCCDITEENTITINLTIAITLTLKMQYIFELVNFDW